MEQKVLQLVIIQSEKGVFITRNDGNPYSTSLEDYVFDGESPVATYVDKWYKLSKIPESVERIIPGETETIGYKLKDGYPICEKFPETVPANFFYSDDEESHEALLPFYEPQVVRHPGIKEAVAFQLAIYKEENWEPVKLDFTPNYGIMSLLVTPGALWSTQPCFITGAELFKLIRLYVKRHIDNKYAKVTSDYDFSFEVKKIFELTEPEAYVFTPMAYGRKKPKPRTEYRKHREVSVLKIGTESKWGKIPDKIEGKSHADLKEKIDEYLAGLIKEINEPLKDCECCKGMGVVLDEKIK